MMKDLFALAVVVCCLAFPWGSSQAASPCVLRETRSADYATTRAWIAAGKAAYEEYAACLKNEEALRDELAAERQTDREKTAEEQRRTAASTAVKNAGPRGISMGEAMSIAKAAVDKMGDQVVDAIVSAPGDKATGIGGPRDAAFDNAGTMAVEAAGHVSQPNGVASRMNGIATRSAVDANSRAMGSLQAGMDGFGKVDSGSAGSGSSAPGFAHLPGTVSAEKPSFSSVKVSGAAARANGGALTAEPSAIRTGNASHADPESAYSTSSAAVRSIQSRQSAEGTRAQQVYEDRKAARAAARLAEAEAYAPTSSANQTNGSDRENILNDRSFKKPSNCTVMQLYISGRYVDGCWRPDQIDAVSKMPAGHETIPP